MCELEQCSTLVLEQMTFGVDMTVSLMQLQYSLGPLPNQILLSVGESMIA